MFSIVVTARIQRLVFVEDKVHNNMNNLLNAHSGHIMTLITIKALKCYISQEIKIFF